MYDIERALAQDGYIYIAGIDEAGRGPLAGPVVAACVIAGNKYIEGVTDSKMLTPIKREKLYKQIIDSSITVGVGIADVEEIERMNIRQANLTAMRRAVSAAHVLPDIILIDGIDTIGGPIPQQAVVKGDFHCYCVAAASIMAKVTRDRIMENYHSQYPEYGFDGHKGYGSACHISAIRKYGPSPIHRLSFLTRILEDASNG